MRKIRIIEHISLDGVIQAPGGPNEDGDYPHGGLAVPHSDPAVGEAIYTGHGEVFDLLLGRRTYDIWSDLSQGWGAPVRSWSMPASCSSPTASSPPLRASVLRSMVPAVRSSTGLSPRPASWSPASGSGVGRG